jgi:hypothetical protein
MPADDPFDELSGTTGLLGAADTGMVLRRERGSKKATLYVTGRDLEEELELALLFDSALCHVLGQRTDLIIRDLEGY